MKFRINILMILVIFLSDFLSAESSEIVNIVNIQSNSINVEITDKIKQYGDIIVVVRAKEQTNIKPMNNKKYTTSDKFMIEDSTCMTGNGNYILYKTGADRKIQYTNLSPDKYYNLDVYQKVKSDYILHSEVSFTTLAEKPVRQTQKIMWSDQSSSSFRLYANGGSGEKSLIVISKSINDFVPVSGIGYKSDSEFGKGMEVADGVFAVLSYNDTSKSVLVTGLEAGIEYFVKSFDFNGKDKSCNYITEVITLRNGGKISTLFEVPKLTSVKISGEKNISVEWIPIKGAKSYEIEVAYDSKFSSPDEMYGSIDVGDLSSYELTDLINNTEYFVRVRATGESGASDYSNVLSIKL